MICRDCGRPLAPPLGAGRPRTRCYHCADLEPAARARAYRARRKVRTFTEAPTCPTS
jgi:hypothetical protein